jgi:FkbM family methyltransferase
VLRLALGKTRSKRLILKGELDFGVVWYESFSLWKRGGKKSHELLKFKMPKYNFEFYCRKNKDDFKTMTLHEDDILEHHFTPKEGDIVVDVGAHIGPYTIIASKRVSPNGKVVSIEADPDNFDLLNRNIQLNKLSNVMALNYAVYSEEKIIKLYLPSGGGEESSYTKYNTIMYDRALNEEKFEVKANTLDYLLLSNMIKQEDVNWIKIDVEGAEYEVLKANISCCHILILYASPFYFLANWLEVRDYSSLSCCCSVQFNQGLQNILYHSSLIFDADLTNSP